ncbi:MAG: HAD-IIB family hydrolase, partial [Polyangiales bacterium]
MSVPRSLLASDLDGTLIPLERDSQRLREVTQFVDVVDDSVNLMLAYVTGSHLALAREGIAEVGLPSPDWFVCDVGTSVYRRSDAGFEPDEAYREAMRAAFGGLSGVDIRAAIGAIEGLDLQEREKQAEFKVSYYTRGRPEPYVDTVQARLDAANAQANLVPSHDPVSGRGLLDVLPAGIAKDYAVRYLHDHSGVDEQHLVYAGDSGNDRAAMLTGFRVIVVGNADEELKKDLGIEAVAQGIAEKIYFAKHPYARGVLEGLRHFGFVSQ